MSGHTNLSIAKKLKNDEFYTSYCDVENELSHYTSQLFGKIVYCPCDDYCTSNFVKYFKNNFHSIGIRHLIATHIHLDGSVSERYDFDGSNESIVKLESNGDFRNEECVKILNECDVVITNPPFSLFKEFILWMLGKDFLVIGNFNAVAWKDVFPLIRDNKVRLGVGRRGMTFTLPDGNTASTNSCWFTTFEHNIGHDELELTKTYSSSEYQKYDNYDAIEVGKTKDIPFDYYGVMGVPITFLDKYNPKQFEIVTIAAGNSWKNFKEDLKKLNFDPSIKYGGGLGACVLNGKGLFARIMIRNKY